MEYEWPIWYLVINYHIPLSEIKTWTLDEIYKALAVVEMQKDYEKASASFDEEKFKNFGKK